MRHILIDWLVDVHYKYRLAFDALHLAICILDRYLSTKTCLRKSFQLAGIVAMLIASKYSSSRFSMDLEDCVYITDRAYNGEDVTRMECDMLRALDYRIACPV